MKVFLFLIVIVFCIAMCMSPSKHQTEIQIKDSLKGVKITQTADSFEVWRGTYHVYAKVKNISKHRYRNLQLNASYLDEAGKELAASIGGPGFVFMPGDSAVIETSWLFPTADKLPNKVVLNLSN